MLEKLIDSNKATVCVIGLGYVGLPMLLRLSEVGFNAIGLDSDKKKISKLNNGLSYIKTIDEQNIKASLKGGAKYVSDFSIIKKVDIILICLPTPLGNHFEPDLSYIEDCISTILPFLRKDQLLSLESTTYPGTTDEIIVPKISKKFKIGKDFFVSYSPEREDPGNKKFNTKNTPKVMGANDSLSRLHAKKFYSKIVSEVIELNSYSAAEMTKLVENIYRSINIGLANELKIIADKLKLDIFEIIDAAGSKPFGFTPFYPGPGLGGHCIPIDPFYLSWKSKEVGHNARFIELSGEINNDMPFWVINKVLKVLNLFKKSVSSSKILLLGAAYKKNIDDYRESPAIKIIDELIKLKASVNYFDPYIDEIDISLDNKSKIIKSIKNINKISNYDLVLLLTDHDCFDYKYIKNNSALIIDTRGRFKLSKKIFRG